MRETWVRSLRREDPLEKKMATHSSILAWKIPWTEEPGRLQSLGSQTVGHDWATSLSLSWPWWDFPCGSAGKESTCNVGDLDAIPGVGRPLEKGKATHSSILAWCSLPSVGLQSVGNNWVTFTSHGPGKLRLEGGARSFFSFKFWVSLYL